MDDTYAPPARLVHQLWISDPEIAGYLRAAYGLPAQFAHFNLTTDTSPVNETTWNFSLPGGEESHLVATKTSPNDQTEMPLLRFFWTNQLGGISYFAFSSKARSSSTDPHELTGMLGAPFIQASPAPYVGYGGPLENADVAAPIVQFSDLSCEKPF